MRIALGVGFLFGLALILLILILLSGCVQVAPNLKLPEAQNAQNTSKEQTNHTVQIAGECPKLDMPPIAKRVTIQITPDKVQADEGGTTMIKNYVRARSLLQ